MTIEKSWIEVHGIPVEIVRKDIKNLHLAVYPPYGRVRIAAPLLINDDAVRMAVITKLGWIKRQQANFENQERQSQREYMTGESHYFQGHRYRLNLVYHDSYPKVSIRNKNTIDFYVRKETDAKQRERLFLAWYRKELKALIPPLISKWEELIGVKVVEWGVKQMKTKWGACNIEAQRIWLNLELAKKQTQCLEYVIVHQMVHLLERHHNDRFMEYMDKFMPQWRFYREELNASPLGHATWEY